MCVACAVPQVCLLDLDYNLPVQVRDSALGIEDETLPGSDVGKEYQLNQMSKDGLLDSSFAKEKPNDTILKLQRTSPYYKVSVFNPVICKSTASCLLSTMTSMTAKLRLKPQGLALSMLLCTALLRH